MSIEKCAIRQMFREWRKQLTPAAVQAAGVAVWERLCAFPPYQTAASVVAYLPTENEIPTDRVIEGSLRAGCHVYLPKNSGNGRLVRWRTGEPLITGRAGIHEPAAEGLAELRPPVIALVPLVAWDEAGWRLGRGAGFFDRLFTHIGLDLIRVGLAYEFQHYPGLPHDPWDVPLQYVITEQRLACCGQPGTADFPLLQKGGLRR